LYSAAKNVTWADITTTQINNATQSTQTPPSQEAKAYFDRGLAKYNSGDKKGAISDFDSAIQIDPQYAKAYYNRGVIKYELGDKHGATAEDGAQASLTMISPSASILKMPMLIPIGVLLNIT
jgi:Tfp pilus assembly protein PilF